MIDVVYPINNEIERFTSMKSNRPYKICSYVGCNKLSRDNYCDEHKKTQREKELQRYKDYNRYSRNNELHSFYNTKEWKRVRAYVIGRDNNLCQMCLEIKQITKADVVHHIKYLETHPELALSPSNLISICHSHHNYLHKDDNKKKGE